MRSAKLLVVVLSLLTTTKVEAQRAGAGVALRTLLGEPRVRIGFGPHETVEGLIVDVNDSTFSIDDGRERRAFALQLIRGIDIPGDAGRAGAGSGAIVVGSLGALFLGGLAEGLCDAADCRGAFVEGARVGAVAGATAGAVAGFVIGSFVTRWEPYWTHERGFTRKIRAAALGARGPGWQRSASAGLSITGIRTGSWMMSGSIEKRRASGRVVGIEAGRIRGGARRDGHEFSLQQADGSQLQVRYSYTYRTSTSYLGVLARRPAFAKGHWGLMAGMSVYETTQDLSTNDPYGGLARRSRYGGWAPVLGVSAGRTFGRVPVELRWIGPVDHSGNPLSFVALNVRVVDR